MSFFEGCTFVVVPTGLGKHRRTLFEKQIKLYGGSISGSVDNQNVTHIVVDESIPFERFVKVTDCKDTQQLKEDGKVVVQSKWLSQCLRDKVLCPTEEFVITPPSESKPSSGNKDADPLDGPMMKKRKAVFKADATAITETPQSGSEGEGSSNRDEDIHRNSDALISDAHELPKGVWVCSMASSNQEQRNHNQHITDKLQEMLKVYKTTNDKWRAFGYQKAIAAVKAYPKEICTWEEARSLRSVGTRLADKIMEIVESGNLSKLDTMQESGETKLMQLFVGVWGAGPHTAKTWVSEGYRSLEDLKVKAKLTRSQQIGLELYDDLNERMSRSEAAEIERIVVEAAQSIQPGMKGEACGSYRRGKATCGDVDVLLTHTDGHSHKGVFGKLLDKLHETGFLTHDLTIADNQAQFKYLGVCKLPDTSPPLNSKELPSSATQPVGHFDKTTEAGEGSVRQNHEPDEESPTLASGDNPPTVDPVYQPRKHRRLDIIVCPWKEYACAVLYFTGSAHFNRSMRLLADKKGWSLTEHSLNTGVVRQNREKVTAGTPLSTPTEESVFKYLGLAYRTPQERDH